jgi:hypothetical protein
VEGECDIIVLRFSLPLLCRVGMHGMYGSRVLGFVFVRLSKSRRKLEV